MFFHRHPRDPLQPLASDLEPAPDQRRLPPLRNQMIPLPTITGSCEPDCELVISMLITSNLTILDSNQPVLSLFMLTMLAIIVGYEPLSWSMFYQHYELVPLKRRKCSQLLPPTEGGFPAVACRCAIAAIAHVKPRTGVI